MFISDDIAFIKSGITNIKTKIIIKITNNIAKIIDIFFLFFYFLFFLIIYFQLMTLEHLI